MKPRLFSSFSVFWLTDAQSLHQVPQPHLCIHHVPHSCLHGHDTRRIGQPLAWHGMHGNVWLPPWFSRLHYDPHLGHRFVIILLIPWASPSDLLVLMRMHNNNIAKTIPAPTANFTCQCKLCMTWCHLTSPPGMFVHECRQLWREGCRDYVLDWWNWMDSSLIFLYLAYYAVQIVVYVKVSWPPGEDAGEK